MKEKKVVRDWESNLCYAARIAIQNYRFSHYAVSHNDDTHEFESVDELERVACLALKSSIGRSGSSSNQRNRGSGARGVTESRSDKNDSRTRKRKRGGRRGNSGKDGKPVMIDAAKVQEIVASAVDAALGIQNPPSSQSNKRSNVHVLVVVPQKHRKRIHNKNHEVVIKMRKNNDDVLCVIRLNILNKIVPIYVKFHKLLILLYLKRVPT